MVLSSVPASELPTAELMMDYEAAVENAVIARAEARKARGDDSDRAYNELCSCERDLAVLRCEMAKRMGNECMMEAA